ncbi:MAG: YhjD/YihY/BrkB family envelope integrity protein [Phycisphaerales bacterium JB050]
MGKLQHLKEMILGEYGEESLSRLQRTLRFGYLLAVHGGKQLVRHRAPQLAAALAYRTIFSLVPVLVLILVVLNATFDQAAIERAFNSVFEYTGLADIQVPAQANDEQSEGIELEVVPDSEAIDSENPVLPDEPTPDSTEANADPDSAPNTVALTEYLSDFVRNAAERVTNLSFGLITVFGLALFLYAAISLLIQVEGAFNVVTGARRGRRIATRLINYWAVLTLGTILIVASLAVGQVYQSRLDMLPGFLAAPLSVLGRFGATWLLLLLAYMQMPTARVFVKPAALGAAVAAIAWESSKSGLFWFVREMTDGQTAIYGSLAILPVALLWIYITWFIVLFGLELAYSFQTVREVDLRRSLRGKVFDDDPMVDTFCPVIITAEIARAFMDGKAATASSIRDQVAEPDDVVARIMKCLTREGFLHAVEVNEDEESSFTLARDPSSFTVADVMEACDHLFDPSASQRQGRRGRKITAMLRSERNQTYASQTMSELVARVTADREPDGGDRDNNPTTTS